MAHFYAGAEFRRFQVEVLHANTEKILKLFCFFCYPVKCLPGHILSVIILHILQQGPEQACAEFRPHYFHPLSVMTALTTCVCGKHLPARCSDTPYSAISESTSRGSTSVNSSPVSRYVIIGSCNCEDSSCSAPLLHILSFFLIQLKLQNQNETAKRLYHFSKKSFRLSSVPAEQVPGIHFISHIIKARVVAVRDDGLRPPLELREIVDHHTHEEHPAVIQRGRCRSSSSPGRSSSGRR